jgi:hypothetical protein
MSCSNPWGHNIVSCRLLLVRWSCEQQDTWQAYLSPTPCWQAPNPRSCMFMSRRPAGRCVASHLNLSDTSQQPYACAPQLSWHIIPPCHVTADEVGCSVSCLFPGTATPLARPKTRSSGHGHHAAFPESQNSRRSWALGHLPLLMPLD